ncbi:MAG: SBBP repeat-containing protein [Ignavibacteriae bacterium]|nr:SBBP repeat-containing protein [Ignavibacteriota bacterium]
MDAFVIRLDSVTGRTVYATRIGGADYDEVSRIAVDQHGFAYAVGFTKSKDFSTSHDAVQPDFGGGDSDAFLVRISPNGDVVYSTLLGGSGADQGNGLQLDIVGNVYIAGTTWSPNFPGQFHNRTAQKGDVFVGVIRQQSAAIRSVVFGGSNDEKLTGIVLSRNEPWLVGYTESPDFPVRRSAQAQLSGNSDLFMAKVSLSNREVLSSTFFGGSGADSGWGITLDRNNNPVVAGTTESTDLHITSGTYQPENNGKTDAFITVFDSSARRIVRSTYVGGSDADSSGYDGRNITLDTQGNIWLAGVTSSGDFPTRRAHQSNYAGGDDGFVIALSPDLKRLCSGSFYGGGQRDLLEGIVYVRNRGIFVTGLTFSADFLPPGVRPISLGTFGYVNAFVVGIPRVDKCS